MIKNFDEVKKQLAELSGIVNKFQSEQVQLKIIERIFKGSFEEPDDEVDDEDREPSEPARRKPKKKKATATGTAGNANKKKPGPKSKGTGPGPTLELLIADGFFAKPKTLREIVEHSRDDLARTIKMSDLSGPLARFVRDKKLNRNKNAEGQYAYKK